MNITVSLTTIPSRLPMLGPTLKSLLEQSLGPAEIVLTLPRLSHREGRGYDLPPDLAQAEAEGKLRILRCEYDWGPATKFIPLLFEMKRAGKSHAAVVVVDDDTIYDRNTLRSYARLADRFPDAVLTVRGGPRTMKLDDFFTHPESRHSDAETSGIPRQAVDPIPVDIVTGAGSFLIRPSFVDDDLLDYSRVPREAFLMDDDHISGHLAVKGVPRLLIPFDGYQMRSNWGFFELNEDAVRQNPLLGWRLDLRLPLMRHYRKHWGTINFGRLGPKLRLKSLWWNFSRRWRRVRFNELLLHRPADASL